jgi:hypothetical protein
MDHLSTDLKKSIQASSQIKAYTPVIFITSAAMLNDEIVLNRLLGIIISELIFSFLRSGVLYH